MYVVGTAGHVDHGKSTLVKALTGIDPDRWEEEQRREMTIDLGFAWFTLPSGRSISLIDVPGHERFIKNMLAGVGGIDAAMLVIAADESLMPQTEEHLAILDLLAVRHGLVVISKCDLVDTEWLELVQGEISERLAGTVLADVPHIAVSARQGSGLDQLRRALDRVLDATPSRGQQAGAPRMSIDRSFTVGGFGTVVTGTLIDGPLNIGQEIELLPSGLRARIRGLQSHRQQNETALPGSRVAVNLAGVHHRDIARGDMLALPGHVPASDRLDVQIRMVGNLAQPLRQNSALDLFVGAAEVRCRATLLDCEELAAGEQGWLQLRLDRPVAALRDDRCILRLPSPSLTVGGGRVVDPQPPRHRRFRAEVIAGLEIKARGTGDELLLQTLGIGPARSHDDLVESTGLSRSDVITHLTQLQATGQVIALATDMVISAESWKHLRQEMVRIVSEYHARYPLRRGMPREELRQRLKLDARQLAASLAAAEREQLLQVHDREISRDAYQPEPGADQQQQLAGYLESIARTPYSPPAPELDGELLAWAVEHNHLNRVGSEIYFLPETYTELLAWVRSCITVQGSISVGQLRDRFGTSRKYALALLEHLDERRITRRSGDVRVLY
jgi:selenocysteine-specific elongation factor